jgi:hypothetical protein
MAKLIVASRNLRRPLTINFGSRGEKRPFYLLSITHTSLTPQGTDILEGLTVASLVEESPPVKSIIVFS